MQKHIGKLSKTALELSQFKSYKNMVFLCYSVEYLLCENNEEHIQNYCSGFSFHLFEIRGNAADIRSFQNISFLNGSLISYLLNYMKIHEQSVFYWYKLQFFHLLLPQLSIECLLPRVLLACSMSVVSKFAFTIKLFNLVSMERDHSFSTYTKLSEKLTICTP